MLFNYEYYKVSVSVSQNISVLGMTKGGRGSTVNIRVVKNIFSFPVKILYYGCVVNCGQNRSYADNSEERAKKTSKA